MDTGSSDMKPILNRDGLGNSVMCTLGERDLATRGLEWADLGELALTSDRIDGGVESTYPLSVADAVEVLASGENQCCGSWLSAVTERTGDAIRLRVTTENADGLAVILRMTGHPT